MSEIGQTQALRTQMHIGGRWVDAGSGATFESTSPATGEVLGVLPEAGAEDARAAVAAAGRAAERFAGLSTYDRARLCHGVADAIERRREALARLLSLEQGKPYAEAFGEVGFAAELFRNAGEDVKRLETGIIPSADPRKRILTIRQPHGVVAVITPGTTRSGSRASISPPRSRSATPSSGSRRRRRRSSRPACSSACSRRACPRTGRWRSPTPTGSGSPARSTPRI